MRPDPEILKDLQLCIRDLSLGIKRLCFSSICERGILNNSTNPGFCCYFACLGEAGIPKLELLLALHMPVFFLAAEGRLDYKKNCPFLTNVQLLECNEQPRRTASLPGLL